MDSYNSTLQPHISYLAKFYKDSPVFNTQYICLYPGYLLIIGSNMPYFDVQVEFLCHGDLHLFQ